MDLLRHLFEGRRRLFWALYASALAVDFWSKQALWHHPVEGVPGREIIPGLLCLISHPGNLRGPFGLGPAGNWFFIGAAIVAVAVIAALMLRTSPRHGLAQAALGLLAGGAVGNLLDRVALGFVRDFIDLHWGRYHWPTFNVADTAICVGFGLVVLDSLLSRRGPEPEEQEGGEPDEPDGPGQNA